MRMWEIFTEAAKDDLDLLGAVAEVVISLLPARIPVDQSVFIQKKQVAHSPKIKAMYESYSEKYHDAIRYLSENVTFEFMNHKRLEGSRTAGMHQKTFEGSNVYVVLPVVFTDAEERSKEELISFRNPDVPLQSVKTVLVHEMRHAIQSIDFPEFFQKDKGVDYRSDPVEIDAAWLHYLNDRPIENYQDADEFVKDVMVDFSKYKRLTAKQVRHYGRKTYRYYYDRIRKGDEKAKTLQQRKMEKIEGYIDGFREKLLDGMMDKSIEDLRNFGHEESGFFLFDPTPFRRFANKMLTDASVSTSDTNVAYIYAFLALVHEAHPFPTEGLVKYFYALYKVTPKEAITILEKTGFGKYDTQFFIEKIKKVFG